MNKEFAISLGGSLIIPGQELNVPYMNSFALMVKGVEAKFGIVTGGGSICRIYQKGIKQFNATDYELDTIGIQSTYLNARALYHSFRANGIATQLMSSYDEFVDPTKKAWVVGGYKPGGTTDSAMIIFADKVGAGFIINATNTPYVYEVHGGTIDFTKPIKDITWKDYIQLIGTDHHVPGENLPFGYTASINAQKAKISVVVLDGKNIENFTNCLTGKQFEGTIIHP